LPYLKGFFSQFVSIVPDFSTSPPFLPLVENSPNNRPAITISPVPRVDCPLVFVCLSFFFAVDNSSVLLPFFWRGVLWNGDTSFRTPGSMSPCHPSQYIVRRALHSPRSQGRLLLPPPHSFLRGPVFVPLGCRNIASFLAFPKSFYITIWSPLYRPYLSS